MKIRPLHWVIALLISVGIHLTAVATTLINNKPETLIAGGTVGTAPTLGDSFVTTLSAGTEEETDPETLEPTEVTETPDAVEPEEVTEVQPQEVTPTVEPAEAEIQPAEAQELASLEASDVAIVQKPDETEPTPPEEQEAQPVEEIKPEEMAEVKPEEVEPVETVTAQPESKPTPPVTRKVVHKRPAKRRAQRSAGAGGASNQTAQRGGGGQVGTSSSEGNSRYSNYPGMVAKKLRRYRRYPSEAQRQNMTGRTVVSFRVDRSGSASAIRVVRSSGYDILDQAALETVRRASPFPDIPSSDQRNSWTFTVPISFTR